MAEGERPGPAIEEEREGSDVRAQAEASCTGGEQAECETADHAQAPSTSGKDIAQRAGVAADTSPPSNGSGQANPLSKNQQKKRRRQEAFEAKHAARKAAEKEAKREQMEAKRAEAREIFAAMDEQQQEAWRQARAGKRQARKDSDQCKRARLQHGLNVGQKLVLDLDFADAMTATEIKSLCQQVAYSYACVVRSSAAVHLMISGLHGAVGECLAKQASGCANWIITRTDNSFLDLFPDRQSDIVYLTADADQELQELDPSKAYVIGGLVDRNRHKNLCLGKAQAMGVATARLPLSGHLKMLGSPVLTVNQVVAILAAWLECRNWQEALERIVPTRKRAAGPAEIAGAQAPKHAKTNEAAS